ncbi:hypothetical protein QH494_03335 [Sphingomonas sp. AR_OL41]|uniref:hypothetical protein n=1 Tax=Sphingomonas sp. AR_OL41 TaxID=3042729 RepID=UPI00248170DF|nr:hypothetical protein [Sphingomonas sp. AR_OL41]MDH7971203.1 hypothetical protein [Sphingomonas sp. AR_OL41]
MSRMLTIGMAGAAMALGALPAMAQDAAADIDRMIDATASPDGALKLARTQADQGDLTGAAATLERALLAHPDTGSADVRLYYVAVLCRLDDHGRARIEASRIDSSSASTAAIGEARTACGSLDLPASGGAAANSGVIGNVALGFAYDTDNSAALSPAFALPGIAVPSNDGLSIVASAQVDARTPVGSGYAYGGLSGMTKNAIGGPNLDYQLGSLRAGFGAQGSGVGFELGGVLRHGRLFGHPFYSEYGGQGELSTAAGDSARVALRGEVTHQDYVGSNAFFDRDGTRFDLAVEYRAGVARDHGWVIGAAFEDKTARTRNLGYQGWRLYAAARLPLNQAGTYSALSATVRHVDYRNVALISDRVETRWFARAALGTPLGSSPVDLEGAVSYTHRSYNAASLLHDYGSFGAELRLVLNFGR